MKIVHIPRRFTRDHWGGTETVVLETCKRLRELGHEIEIVSSRALSSLDHEDMDGIPVSRVRYSYPYLGMDRAAREQLDFKGGNIFSFQLLRKLQKMPNLDVIHLHTGKRFGGIGRYVARKRGIPYVVSLHGGAYDVPDDEAATWTDPSRGALEWGKVLGWWVGSRRVLADADAVICVGRREQEITQERYPGQRVLHLPNAVDSDRFQLGDGAAFRAAHGIPEDALVLTTIGRIDPQKNQLFLARRLPELVRRNPATHLVIIGPVGNARYEREIHGAIDEAGLGRAATIIPGLPAAGQELVDAYHAADIFALPSRHEPFGIAILEAWAAGRPVIASRVGGIPGFVEDGEDGLLHESDDVEGFLAAFGLLSKSPSRRRALAAAGRRKAREEYSWEVAVKRLVDLYEEVRCENPLRA